MGEKYNKWYMNTEGYDDVVVSSRVVLSRNLADFDFSGRLASDDALKLVEKVRALTPGLAGRECEDYYSCTFSRLPETEQETLVESGAVTQALKNKKQGTGLILSEDESVSIMINESDHLKIQVIKAGNNMREAYKVSDRIDNFFDSELKYAYSEKYGFLTSSTTDVGTGLKATYQLSLPALAMSSKIQPIRDEVGKFGVAIEPVVSESGKGAALMFDISNRRTLGLSENDIIENLDQITGQIVELERKRRESMLENERTDLEDKIYRSYGVLKYARKISLDDALMLLAQLKLGADMGIVTLSPGGMELHRLMIEMRPACLIKEYKCDDDRNTIDEVRAMHLNKKLPKLKQGRDD
ncbi:MAG: hypothetical protein J6Y89_06290 [Lachnospiraceae bacterium]|nr:hypothetical protein [Lachnospiraceae bacterium]